MTVSYFKVAIPGKSIIMEFMLRNTFVHIQGIGAVTERKLWEAGIRDWDCLKTDEALALPHARPAIFAINLRRRGRDPADYDLDHLARVSDGFSGAEIEKVIVSALYSAFSENAPLDPKYLNAEVSKTPPLSKTRAEDIAFLRQWARQRTISAQ